MLMLILWTTGFLFWGLCSRGGTLWKSMRMIARPFVESRGTIFLKIHPQLPLMLSAAIYTKPQCWKIRHNIHTLKHDPAIQNSSHWVCRKGWGGSQMTPFIKRPNIQPWETGDKGPEGFFGMTGLPQLLREVGVTQKTRQVWTIPQIINIHQKLVRQCVYHNINHDHDP